MTPNKIPVASMNCEELMQTFNFSQKFRAKQIFKWISEGVDSFDKMSNLSKDLRQELSEKAVIFSSKIIKKLVDPDGTIKIQFETFDGNYIEAVLLSDKAGRKTACISSQVGCAMGCIFCKTGTLGFARNLEAFEIVEQFMYLENEVKTQNPEARLDNIVFMGMGEPMLNLNNVRKAIAILSDADGRNFSPRRITISTCGIIKGIYDLADNGPAVRLAVSLTTADPELREKMMPVTKANPLNELREAIRYFTKKSGKRCTLEAALVGKMNTGEASIKNMINFTRNMDVMINLIPWNKVEGLDFEEPTKTECENFCSSLEKAGLNVTFRTKKGKKIGGACGQLGKVTK